VEYSTFLLRTKVIHGVGTISQLGREIQETVKGKGLLVTDKGLVQTEIFPDIEQVLKDANVEYEVYSGIEGEASTEHLHQAYQKLISSNCNFVIGFGGGSSIDVAKGVALLATNNSHIKDYAGMRKFQNKPLPLFAIPTTAGTGSEVTHGAVFMEEETNEKFTVNHPELNPPILAILDPTLLRTIPRSVAAISSIDALTHAIESFVSKKSNPLTECLSLQAAKLIIGNIIPFLEDPTNSKHAYNVLLGSNIAGIAFAHAGTGNSHCLARYIGGRSKIAHGVLCGLTIPAVVEFNLSHSLEKYAAIARLFNSKLAFETDEQAAKELPILLEALLTKINFPQSLKQLGLVEGDLRYIAKDSANSWYNDFNPRHTSENDFLQILSNCY
jgi:alcohol dehydrogenase